MIEEDKSEIVSFVDEDTETLPHPSQNNTTTTGNVNTSNNIQDSNSNANIENHSSNYQDNSLPTSQNSPHNEQSNGDEKEEETDSISNIIPPQLQKGFSIFSSWVNQTAFAVSTKASEVNNSETMKDFKQKSQRFANDTIVAASPMWEATKENVNLAMEVTYQSTSQVVEQLKPALHEV